MLFFLFLEVQRTLSETPREGGFGLGGFSGCGQPQPFGMLAGAFCGRDICFDGSWPLRVYSYLFIGLPLLGAVEHLGPKVAVLVPESQSSS